MQTAVQTSKLFHCKNYHCLIQMMFVILLAVTYKTALVFRKFKKVGTVARPKILRLELQTAQNAMNSSLPMRCPMG